MSAPANGKPCGACEEAAKRLNFRASEIKRVNSSVEGIWYSSVYADQFDLLNREAEGIRESCKHSVIAFRTVADGDDLDAIERDVGMGHGAWDTVSPLEIIESCWRRYRFSCRHAPTPSGEDVK